MNQALIYDVSRTPRGKGKKDGSLHTVKPVDLLAGLMREMRQRLQLNTALVDDAVIGCVTPVADQGACIAKTALLAADWDTQCAGVQINRFCASGLEAVNMAAQKVAAGWDQLVLAGGVESMSRVPMGYDGGAWAADPATSMQTGFVPQGIGADLIATLAGFSREELDRFALASQQKAAAARAAGRFKSMKPVYDMNGALLLAEDEFIKADSSLEGLAKLKPAFEQLGGMGFDAVALAKYPHLEQIQHLHSAGNSSGIVDGAALCLIGNQAIGDMLGLRARARIVACAVTSTEPTIMLTGPAPATRKALAMAGLTVEQIDLFEVNEAFASVVLRFARELDVPLEKINVNGGAIALGHPLGATGCILIGTLLDELELRQARYGLATLCVGGGMGIATIIERI
ncbi:acetyl-CoA C-acetyltransferase [Massilia sp. W12]|uniref:acetyl-CoA C-acetyltransferase n=1 Tax=Massilia sp. W12 TaxID=3126507 RepID=UPI0030D1EAD7